MKCAVFYLLVCSGLCFNRPELSANDIQHWNDLGLNWRETERLSLTSVLHTRIYNDISNFHEIEFGQEVATSLTDWLTGGINFRFTETKDSLGEFAAQRRWELQLTSRWSVSERLQLDIRNRIEFTRGAGIEGTWERSRHRLQLGYRTASFAKLQRVYMRNESFYSMRLEKVSENRAEPLGLIFRRDENTAYQISYMIRSTRRGTVWIHDHIIQTGFGIRI